MKNFFQSILRFLGLAKSPEPVSLITELVSYEDDISQPKADDYFLADKDSEAAVAAAPPAILAVIVDATPSPDPVPTIAEITSDALSSNIAPKSFLNENGNPAVNAYFKEVVALRSDDSFVLDLYIEGFASMEHGFTSFQIGDVAVSNGVDLISFDKGSILRGTPDGLGGYITKGEFVSSGIIDFANKRAYYARFGGYGSSSHAVNVDGTLYRFYFKGNAGKDVIELKDFYFSNGLGNFSNTADPVKY